MESFEKGIYLGDRGFAFMTLIRNTLKIGNIPFTHLDYLLSENCMEEYSCAFTSEDVNSQKNYQVAEQLGDATGNKFLVEYFYDRFPQLRSSRGVKIVARLRINYGSKKSFCEIADQLGFWDFISASYEARNKRKKSLLEDVFEAFIGITERMLDLRFNKGGYFYIYNFLKSIFDKKEISLCYEDLYDPKTRLKELVDMHETSDQKLRILYTEKKTEKTTTCIVSCKIGDKSPVEIGHGTCSLKIDAQQKAAHDALCELKKKGYYKKPPRDYILLAGREIDDSEKRKLVDIDIRRIMDQGKGIDFISNKKSSQPKYSCTLLTTFCKQGNTYGIEQTIKAGADPNSLDSYGMTSVDNLIMSNPQNYSEAVMRFISKRGSFSVHEDVFLHFFGNDKRFVNMNFLKKLENSKTMSAKNFNLEDIKNCIEEMGYEKITYNMDGKLHSFSDEPALINSFGSFWYRDGILHRDRKKGPAAIGKGGKIKIFIENGCVVLPSRDKTAK